MSELSENLKATVENMVKFYEELARLFLDADDLMIRNAHRVLKGSALESESCRSLNYPRWWLMFGGIRYYIPDADPHLGRAIGVFVYNSRHEPTEPVLVLGAFRGDPDEVSGEEINPAGALWDAWNKMIPEQTLGLDHAVGAVRDVSRGIVHGMLLEEVTDFEALETKVVNVLLGMNVD